jgi:hypothetical protein
MSVKLNGKNMAIGINVDKWRDQQRFSQNLEIESHLNQSFQSPLKVKSAF